MAGLRRPRLGVRRGALDHAASREATSDFWVGLRASQPAFWPAVVADAQIAAQFRGERHPFHSGWDALRCAVRLAWVTDSFFAQMCYRAEVAVRKQGVPMLPAVLHRVAIMTGQIAIGRYVVMQPGVYLPHGQVVVDGATFVGAGAVLRPFVTLGLVDGHVFGPNIGPHVRIGTGAKVIGPVRVGARAQVGANAVVIADVPAGGIAVGVPARLVP